MTKEFPNLKFQIAEKAAGYEMNTELAVRCREALAVVTIASYRTPAGVFVLRKELCQ